jgi:hypothetical protein
MLLPAAFSCRRAPSIQLLIDCPPTPSLIELLVTLALLGCSGNCDDGSCGAPIDQNHTAAGEECALHTDCESGWCGSGTCIESVATCEDQAEACEVDSECCSGNCGTNGVCLADASVCIHLSDACEDATDCCTGNCQGGSCTLVLIPIEI